MAMCKECERFHLIPDTAWDNEKGVGDCVRELRDEKGKYWHSRKEKEDSTCSDFKAKSKQ